MIMIIEVPVNLPNFITYLPDSWNPVLKFLAAVMVIVSRAGSTSMPAYIGEVSHYMDFRRKERLIDNHVD